MRKVERTSAGHFKVRFRLSGRQTSETFAVRAEAERFARLLMDLGPQGALDELYAGDQANPTPTLDELARDHIELLTGVEDGTRKTYTRLWDRTWHPRLGHLHANQLTRDHVARAINELGRSYARKSLENQRGLLSAVVQRGVDLGYAPKNHARGIRLPRGKEAQRTEMRIVTPAEFAVLIELVPEHYRALVRFLYGTGCRWGEAVALEVQDVQLPNVRIRRALKWSPDNQRHVGATKTVRSNRTVVVGDVMLEDLQQLTAGRPGDALVFTAPRGGAVLHRTFWSRVWLPAAQHLVPRPRIHDLRHSHASVLLAAGVPVHVVRARLGHESIKTTVDTYSHLLPDAQLAAAAAAALAFHSGDQRAALPAQQED